MKTKIPSKYKGISLLIAFGCYGGFHTVFTKDIWRVCLGWLSITVFMADMDAIIADYLPTKKP